MIRMRILVLAVMTGCGLMAARLSAQEQATVKAPTTPIPREGCVTSECHAGIKQHDVLHAPIHVNACEACHTLIDPAAHAYEDTRPREQMCLFCHTLDMGDATVIHEPVRKGECTSCHDPHGGAGVALLRGPGYRDLCRSCHDSVGQAQVVVHGPTAAGACGACHQPHASSKPMLLVTEGRALCLQCHVSIGIELETLRNVHEPARGDCLLCHDPHSTDHPAALRQDPKSLCIECHKDMEHRLETATTAHAAVTTERKCLNCHSGHASDYPGLLQEDTMTLCFECHDREIELPDGTRLANMKAIIESGTSLHGPTAQHDCTACHEIHGGGHQRLLTAEYPDAFYLPFTENEYALCFNCHDRQMVMLEETSTVTRFRNGTQNLHYTHVHKDRKGRSCRVCHDTHASNRANHIRDVVPFGPKGWPLPIKFEATERGGGCAAGCHQAFRYDRDKPLVYPEWRKEEDWKGENLKPATDGGKAGG